MLQQQQLLMGLVAVGAATATRQGNESVGRLVVDAASLLQDVANSGYSQEQELEADQLGIRYVMRAGFDPQAALVLLEDFARFDRPWAFLRTHPYMRERRAQLERYLAEVGAAPPSATRSDKEIGRLRRVQQSYPVGSTSWQNLQRQIERLERAGGR
jgi:predicted Zn-dependent protease